MMSVDSLPSQKKRAMCAKLYRIIFCIFVLLCVCTKTFADIYEDGRARIILKDGEIEGKQRKTVDKRNVYYSFQGVPYAEPPVGKLRFADPQPPKKWESVLDATKPGKTCIEMYYQKTGQEDCLYLNVFTPNLEKSLPVIVWIHGGAFVFIYGNYSLSGIDYFMDEEVVFVTINYRMGPFGFLSTEDDIIPGNFGLKDQVMAIEWVHENIAKFGGDPNKITIMGQSAGAVSAGYMGMVPQLRGKIAGIIQQSGSPLCPFGFGRYHRVSAYILSTRMGLQSQNSVEILEHLRKMDAEELRRNALITHMDVAFGMGTFHGLVFIPGLESKTNMNPLLTELSHAELQNGNFNKVPRMIGINSQEGIFIANEFKSINKSYQNYDQMIKRYIPVSMNTRNEKVGHLIKKHYTNDTSFTSNLNNMIHFGSDDQFVRPVLRDAALVSKHVTTYLYHFSYEGKLGYPGEKPISGVDHGEEIPYLFHDKNYKEEISENDKMVRYKLVRLWSNFAKFANPTPKKDGLFNNQIWKPIDPSKQDIDYMDIGSKLVPNLNPHQQDIQFWNNLYEKYGNPPYDTY